MLPPLNESISDPLFRRIQNSKRFQWRVLGDGTVRATYGGRYHEARSLCQALAPLLALAGVDPS